MAFNVGSFVKDSAKSIIGSAVDNIIGNVVSNLASNSRLPAKNVAESMFNIGASYQSVEAFSALKTDSIISGASNEFFGLAGKEPSRIGATNMADLRSKSVNDLKVYLQKINPETKISNKKFDSIIEILAVV